MENNKGFLHFRVGNNLPKLIGDIAQEKLIYQLNPGEAVNVLEKSLSIKDEKIIFNLLSGKEYCLVINEETQEVSFTSRKDHPESNYPILEAEKHIDNWLSQSLIDYNCFFRIFTDRERDYLNNDRPSFEINISLDLKMLINILSNHINETKDFIYSKIIDRFNDREDEFFYGFTALGELLVSCKSWFVGTLKKIDVIKFLSASKISELTSKNKIDLFNLEKGLGTLYNRLMSFMKTMDLTDLLNDYQDELLSWLMTEYDASSFIDYIVPTDPEIGCDAAWISPEGDYFGLNGSMNNMLHNQISDLLLKSGIIPKDYEISPDYWLEMNGWVKLHNDWVLFDPYEHKINEQGIAKMIRNITDQQIDTIYKYGKSKYSGILKFGYLHKKISVDVFKNEMDNISRNSLFKLWL